MSTAGSFKSFSWSVDLQKKSNRWNKIVVHMGVDPEEKLSLYGVFEIKFLGFMTRNSWFVSEFWVCEKFVTKNGLFGTTIWKKQISKTINR
jgi:hypothetical protein